VKQEEAALKKKILVIEDEVHIQRLVKMLLEKNGYEVDAASDGEAGLTKLNSDVSFDLVLLDIMMPGMDGLQVLRALKASSSTKHIKVVLLSALGMENVVLQGVKLGAKDYIRKPFHPQELVERIGKIFDAAP